MAYRSNHILFSASAVLGLPTAFFACPFGFDKLKKKSSGSDSKDSDGKTTPGELIFINGVSCIPHDSKKAKGGEDGWCATDRLIVVADGVGGWAEQGVDPGLFSKQLCKDIQGLFEQDSKVSLKEILVKAVEMNKNVGSSTAVLASLEGTDTLKTTNLGDSGYVIFRASKEGKKVELAKQFRSVEQQYRFNFPY